jgi:hypothetical protein
MRLPQAGPLPRHGHQENLETSIQNWRDTFLNKYHDQSREVGRKANLRWTHADAIVRADVCCGSRQLIMLITSAS